MVDMNGDLIEQFVDPTALEAMRSLLESQDTAKITKDAVTLSAIFNAGDVFANIANSSAEAEEKLLNSFYNNLLLLIQKTWIEKTDEELKAQVLYHLENFSEFVKNHSYAEAYTVFLGIVNDVVYLMFGAQAKSKDFDEYALRIDPEFGIFWWYIHSLPEQNDWSLDKKRIVILLGMFFLANY